jgi:ribonuclease HI
MAPTYWHSFADCERSSSSNRIFVANDHFSSGADTIELPVNGWNFVRCSLRSGHTDGIVIAVDGACRHNGSPPAASAAFGVFVAPRSGYNVGRALPAAHATSQKAELQAGIAGLRAAADIARNAPYFRNNPLRQVVVKADSAYLVDGITDWIRAWRRNGYVGARGEEVVNAEHFRELDALVGRLEAMGVAVLFWHVAREQNAEADKLANDALASVRVAFTVGAVSS